MSATGNNRKKSPYSEGSHSEMFFFLVLIFVFVFFVECASILVSAPSSGGDKGIITCDVMGEEGKYDVFLGVQINHLLA